MDAGYVARVAHVKHIAKASCNREGIRPALLALKSLTLDSDPRPSARAGLPRRSGQDIGQDMDVRVG